MSLNAKSTLITSCSLFDFVEFRENMFIHFKEKILHVDHMDNYQSYRDSITDKSMLKELHSIDGQNLLIMPGLLAGHTHIYSTFARGLSMPFDPHSFQEILDQLWWKLDGALNLDDVYYSGLYAGLSYLRSGVTGVIDHHASGQIIGSLNRLEKGVCQELGLRGGFCFETSDRFDTGSCIRENMNFMENDTDSEKSFGMFGMHASMSLSDATLQKIKEVIGKRPIHIHVAESLDDQNLCLQQYGQRIVKRLDAFGLLNPGTILAHCIHIDEEEAAIIRERQCYVAINVTSNMNNSVGLVDIERLKRHGIRCIIGNDGMTSDIASEWRNLLFAMHHQTGSPVGFDLNDLKEMILNSYVFFQEQLRIKIGRLLSEYESDLIAIDYCPPTPLTPENALGHFIYGLSHQLRPKFVWTQGVLRIKNYETDESELQNVLETLKHCQEISRSLWERLSEGMVRE